MDAEQVQWATQFREIPITFRQALRTEDDRAIRHRPALGEWSAIEVLGHMIDKMTLWSTRVERILHEERPSLPGYDQDAGVRDHGYQHADSAVLSEHLQQRCERFAALVAALPSSALQREGVHGEFGPMTLRQCIQTALESAPEHLAQLCAAQEVALADIESRSEGPLWVAGAFIVSWLGMWVHEFYRVPAQLGFTLEDLLFHLLPAIIVFLAWWRFPRHVLPLYGMWVLGILHGLGGGILSVLPLPIWPFVPEQTVSHYIVHGVYFIAQIPLLLLAFTLMRRLRVAPRSADDS